jgi:hypothetical protein
MVHQPVPTKLTVEPDTEQTDVLSDEKVTGFPEPPPVALTVYGDPPSKARGSDEVKLMCCAPTTKDCWA